MSVQRYWAVALSIVLAAAAAVVAVPAGPAYARPIEDDFSISVAGAYGNKVFDPQESWISVTQSNQVEQQAMSVAVMSKQTGASQMSFDFSSWDGSKRDLEVGYYPYNADGSGLRISLSRGNGACKIDRAAVDITDIAFSGPDSELALLDLTLDVQCRAAYGDTVTGRVTFHDRDDLTAPAAPATVEGSRAGDNVILKWQNPDDPGLAGVLVRWYSGDIAPTATDAGEAVYVGTGESVRFPAPGTVPVAASLWAYDTSGNVSQVKTIVIAPRR